MNDQYPIWTKENILETISVLLGQIAPLKVTEPVTEAMSFAEDLDFDSLDVIDLLTIVNEHFSITLDFEEWLSEESSKESKQFTVGSFCLFVFNSLKGEIQ